MYEYKATLNRVIDGDTVDVDVQLGFYIIHRIRLRLIGIDTPEVRGEERPEGLKAKAYLQSLLRGAELVVRTTKTGKYGRWLAIIFLPTKFFSTSDPLFEAVYDSELDMINVNELLFASGHAERIE